MNLKTLQTQKEKLKTKQTEITNKLKELETKREDFCKDILLQAIVTGTEFTIRHGETAPYSHGYYIQSPHVKDGYCNAVTCKDPWYENIVPTLYQYLKWSDDQYTELAKKVKQSWRKQPKTYHRDMHGPDPHAIHGHHIANGYETDGFLHIVQGHCGGTYSSWTTSSQNLLARELCILRGFGADYYLAQPSVFDIPIELIESMYQAQGILGPNEPLDDVWCQNHPERCVL